MRRAGPPLEPWRATARARRLRPLLARVRGRSTTVTRRRRGDEPQVLHVSGAEQPPVEEVGAPYGLAIAPVLDLHPGGRRRARPAASSYSTNFSANHTQVQFCRTPAAVHWSCIEVPKGGPRKPSGIPSWEVRRAFHLARNAIERPSSIQPAPAAVPTAPAAATPSSRCDQTAAPLLQPERVEMPDYLAGLAL